MARAGPLAGAAAGLQLMAGVGAPFVDAAGHGLADLAGERGAARRRVVGAAHAAEGAVHVDRKAGWHPAAVVVEFVDAEVDAVAGAAGAALLAIGHAAAPSVR